MIEELCWCVCACVCVFKCSIALFTVVTSLFCFLLVVYGCDIWFVIRYDMM